MKTSEKIVKRLREMGLIRNAHPIVRSYRGSRNGSWNWCVSDGGHDIGSIESMTICLHWKKWVYDTVLHEIFEYTGKGDYSDCIIEGS